MLLLAIHIKGQGALHLLTHYYNTLCPREGGREGEREGGRGEVVSSLFKEIQ